MLIPTSLFFRVLAVIFFLISVSAYLSILSLSTSSLVSDLFGIIVLFVLFLIFVAPSGLICSKLYNLSGCIERYRLSSLLIILIFLFHLPYLFSLYITFFNGAPHDFFILAFILPLQLIFFFLFFFLSTDVK